MNKHMRDLNRTAKPEKAKPKWLKIKYAQNSKTKQLLDLMKEFNLHSVCQSAHCPNLCECWSLGTASFMILGEFCTRSCKFCAVKTMAKPPPPNPSEPKDLSKAVALLGLKYVVITSVTRDDLKDGGARHFAECVVALKKNNPKLIVETLIPDFQGDTRALRTVIESKPDVISHNIETVERLSSEIRDVRATYMQSLEVLRQISELSCRRTITKSSLMVGLGETKDDVEGSMKDLIGAHVEILTIGQYLQPSPNHAKLQEYVKPETFADYEKKGYELGFKYVASGPFVRSSYKAGEPFIKNILRSRISE